jgi:chromosome partitioning protein
MTSVSRFRAYRREIGAHADLIDAGIVLGAIRENVPSRDTLRAIDEFESAYGEMLLRPLVPERVVVREARAAGDYYGWYPAGQKVHAAYMTLAERYFQ